jgi:hypothetical protein
VKNRNVTGGSEAAGPERILNVRITLKGWLSNSTVKIKIEKGA